MKAGNFPISWVREQFPALSRPEIFSDNAAGTQLPVQAVKALNDYILSGYALGGSSYRASKEADQLTAKVRPFFADFLGAASAEEIHFGINATNLLRLLATSLEPTLKSGDEVILTAMDHEANVTPWLRFQHKGVGIHYWKPKGPEAILAEGDLRALLSGNTRYLMVTGASNVLGTANDLKRICGIAHAEGTRVIVDAVHLAPHRSISVAKTGVDALVCSGYKLFGPKLGFMYVKADMAAELQSLNHFFLPDNKFELGAPNYEAIAAFQGVFEYLSMLSSRCGGDGSPATALDAVADYEKDLTLRMLEGVNSMPNIDLYGISSEKLLPQRLPTFALTHRSLTPVEMGEKLAVENIHCRYGHMYAPRLLEAIKLKPAVGVCRLSLAHYNTVEEVDRILEVLAAI